jgi:hypothetical protein
MSTRKALRIVGSSFASQEVLESRYFIEIHRVFGPPQVYDFFITT